MVASLVFRATAALMLLACLLSVVAIFAEWYVIGEAATVAMVGFAALTLAACVARILDT